MTSPLIRTRRYRPVPVSVNSYQSRMEPLALPAYRWAISPAALRQAALHHRRVDGVVPGDGIELERHTAVVALLRVHRTTRGCTPVTPAMPSSVRQSPLVQIDASEPVVRHILPLQMGGGDALLL